MISIFEIANVVDIFCNANVSPGVTAKEMVLSYVLVDSTFLTTPPTLYSNVAFVELNLYVIDTL